MMAQSFSLNHRCSTRLALAVLLTAAAVALQLRSGRAQTNLSSTAGAPTNDLSGFKYRLPIPSDFQRLQYYYAARQNSPAPGTEHGMFTLRADGKWSEDWSSRVVPRPTHAQLNAITPQQVDLFRRAGAFTNGSWQIVTSLTNIPLSTLSVSAAPHAQLRAVIDRDRSLERSRRLAKSLVAPVSTTDTGSTTRVRVP